MSPPQDPKGLPGNPWGPTCNWGDCGASGGYRDTLPTNLYEAGVAAGTDVSTAHIARMV